MISGRSTRVAFTLWLLWAAFLARVVGQIVVGVTEPSWLPEWEAWMSGAMPYPYLLATQVGILVLYAKIAADFSRGRGWFVEPRPILRTGLFGLAVVYFSSMIVRWVVSFLPRFAWLGDPIPIVFHLVLSGFLLVVALWHRGRRP